MLTRRGNPSSYFRVADWSRAAPNKDTANKFALVINLETAKALGSQLCRAVVAPAIEEMFAVGPGKHPICTV
jgi:hypothetical protein